MRGCLLEDGAEAVVVLVGAMVVGEEKEEGVVKEAVAVVDINIFRNNKKGECRASRPFLSAVYLASSKNLKNI
jgi:hypothetical protein